MSDGFKWVKFWEAKKYVRLEDVDFENMPTKWMRQLCTLLQTPYPLHAAFKKIMLERFPQPGDLIRNKHTSCFINLVVEVSNTRLDDWGKPFVYVRSVRYAKQSCENTTYLYGRRSRSIKWYGYGHWDFVEEQKANVKLSSQYYYTKADNEHNIKEILHSLEGVKTAYQPLEE